MGDLGTYLASIDFRLAVLVAAVAVVVAFVVRGFILGATEEGLAALPLVGDWLARTTLARRRGVPSEPWFCTTCRSLNSPAATVCYRGCGPREVVAAQAAADQPPVDMPIDARPGTTRRRG